MPGAACHACVLGVQPLLNSVGNRNEPFGACGNCYSLACGHHGHRDPNKPEFICVECDPTLLAASAASMGPPVPVLQRLLVAYRSYAMPLETWRFTSLEDFQRRRPGYGREFFAEVGRMRLRVDPALGEHDLLRAVRELPEGAQELLAAAWLIVVKLNLRERVGAHLLLLGELFAL